MVDVSRHCSSCVSISCTSCVSISCLPCSLSAMAPPVCLCKSQSTVAKLSHFQMQRAFEAMETTFLEGATRSRKSTVCIKRLFYVVPGPFLDPLVPQCLVPRIQNLVKLMCFVTQGIGHQHPGMQTLSNFQTTKIQTPNAQTNFHT